MKITIDLRPFQTPNYAIYQFPLKLNEPSREPISFPLSEIPRNELEAMCKAFRDEVMKKAGY